MKYTCPCCGYQSLLNPPPGTFDVCPICFWEDDNFQFEDPELAGGANQVSLRAAQANFQEFGASSLHLERRVRQPKSDEVKDLLWRPLDG